MSDRPQAALAGQPNTGKSTIFNMLTGTRQFVANYPGVTVEKKSGYFKHQGQSFELIDLPGTYSMTSFSLEERVARDFLLEEKPELTINVVDATNLKRNLYLTFQLLEMGLPMILVLNMMDVVKKQETEINLEELSSLLGIPVVAAVGSKGRKKTINQKFKEKNPLYYGFLKPKGDKKATKINRGVRKLLSTQKRIRREIKQDKIANGCSFP